MLQYLPDLDYGCAILYSDLHQARAHWHNALTTYLSSALPPSLVQQPFIGRLIYSVTVNVAHRQKERRPFFFVISFPSLGQHK